MLTPRFIPTGAYPNTYYTHLSKPSEIQVQPLVDIITVIEYNVSHIPDTDVDKKIFRPGIYSFHNAWVFQDNDVNKCCHAPFTGFHTGFLVWEGRCKTKNGRVVDWGGGSHEA